MRWTFWANSNLADVIDIDREMAKRWSLPKRLKKELDDIGFVGGPLFIGASRRAPEEVQRQLAFDPLVARTEWSLNRRDLDYYLGEAGTSVADAFRTYLAASFHVKELTRSLGVDAILCEFSAPSGVAILNDPLDHITWTFYRVQEEFVHDPDELDDFKINSVAGLLL